MKNEKGLYDAIEVVMSKKPKEQFTAHQLWAISSVRKFANSANRISDYLGNMWRRGDLLRLPNPGIDESSARYCYQWKPKGAVKPADVSSAIEYRSKKLILERPEVTVSEQGNEICIETTGLFIIIKRK